MRIISCLVGAGIICPRLLLISLFVAPITGFLLVSLTRRLKKVSHRMLMRSTSYHDVMLESLGKHSDRPSLQYGRAGIEAIPSGDR